jgi:hypothetical protein
LVVGFCWVIVVAETNARSHKVNDLLKPRRDLSIQELMDFCLLEEKTVYGYELPAAFEWVNKMDLEVKTSSPQL